MGKESLTRNANIKKADGWQRLGGNLRHVQQNKPDTTSNCSRPVFSHLESCLRWSPFKPYVSGLFLSCLAVRVTAGVQAGATIMIASSDWRGGTVGPPCRYRRGLPSLAALRQPCHSYPVGENAPAGHCASWRRHSTNTEQRREGRILFFDHPKPP